MEMFYKTIVRGDSSQHFVNGSVELVIKDILKKFTCFLKQWGYLTPFQWALMANFINRLNSTITDFCANPVECIALNTVFSSCFQEEGILLNSIFRTNEALMIDLAFMRYIEKENILDPNNRYKALNLWSRQRLNRDFRRKLDRKVLDSISSLYLFIFEVLINTTAKSKWLKEAGSYRVARHEVRSLQNLSSISQIIKENVPSWEIGPPKVTPSI